MPRVTDEALLLSLFCVKEVKKGASWGCESEERIAAAVVMAMTLTLNGWRPGLGCSGGLLAGLWHKVAGCHPATLTHANFVLVSSEADRIIIRHLHHLTNTTQCTTLNQTLPQTS